MGCIYGIRNEVNQKWYVGKTIEDGIKRKSAHFTGKGSQLLKNAIAKYGVENFTFHILHNGILNIFLDDYEIQTIKEYNSVAPNGYNLTQGGEGTIPSEETRRKISVSVKRTMASPEVRQKLSKARKGKPSPRKGKKASAETRRKLSESHKGKPSPRKGVKVSIATRQKISEAAKGRKVSAETRSNMSKSQKERYAKQQLPYKEFYLSLPDDMPIDEKRKRMYKTYPDIHYTIIWRWVNKWQLE